MKIRKGQAVTLMRDATNMQAFKAIMYQYLEEVSWVVVLTDFCFSSNVTIHFSAHSDTLVGLSW